MTNIFRRLFGRREAGPPPRDVAALAAPLAVPAVRVVRTDAPSLSHLGGSPDLPPGLSWPVRDGAKLAFLARLSLAEVHRAHAVDWLPSSGALLFFYDVENQPWGYDPKDRGGWSVLLAPDLPRAAPQPAARPAGDVPPFPHRNVSFRRVDAFPSWERDSVVALRLSETESDLYCDLGDRAFGEDPRHQVSGFPSPIQDDGMELQCQLASHGVYCGDADGRSDPRAAALTPGAAHWRLLFQMDTDDDLRAMWGDGGMLYFWVEEQAARAGRFENTWLVLQCH